MDIIWIRYGCDTRMKHLSSILMGIFQSIICRMTSEAVRLIVRVVQVLGIDSFFHGWSLKPE